jgi:hypothetical protein
MDERAGHPGERGTVSVSTAGDSSDPAHGSSGSGVVLEGCHMVPSSVLQRMKSIAGRSLGGALLLSAALAAACHQRDLPARGNGPEILDAIQDPGAHVVATNQYSQAMINADAESRRAGFRLIVTGAGHPCSFVTSDVLKAGDDDVDLWRVACADGAWLVTFGPGAGTKVERCPDERTDYCADRLKGLNWGSGRS